MKSNLFIALLIMSLAFTHASALEVPYLTGRVNDYANVLADDVKQRMTAKLNEHESATTNQVVVLTLTSLEDDDVETFAAKVFETWKLGQSGTNNGVLLLISIQDRKMRIEVGYGLEGVLPDGVCGSIIRNQIVPHFRRGDYGAGLDAGVDAIMSAIKGEYKKETPPETNNLMQGLEFPYNIVMGIFVFSILGLFTVLGVFSKGCMSWFLYLFLIPFYATFPLVIIGVMPGMTVLGIYAIGYPLIKIISGSKFGQNLLRKRLPKIYKLQQKGIEWSSGSSSGKSWSFSSGHSSGSSFSSSSSSSSFSGGGGSSGGGGASGSW